jgi:hypothetical protein
MSKMQMMRSTLKLRNMGKDVPTLSTSFRLPTYEYKFNAKDTIIGDSRACKYDYSMRRNPAFQKEIIRSQVDCVVEKLDDISKMIYRDGVYDKIIIIHEKNIEWVKNLNDIIEETLAIIDFNGKLLLHDLLKEIFAKKLLRNPLDNNKLRKVKSEEGILRQNCQLVLLFQDYLMHLYKGYQILTENPKEVYLRDNSCILILVTLERTRFNCHTILE